MEELSRFVASKLALLDEETELSCIEIESAWSGIRAKVDLRRSMPAMRWRWPLAAAAVAGFVMLTPAGRLWSETVWTKLVLKRAPNIVTSLDYSNPSLLLPNVSPWAPPGARPNKPVTEAAGSADDASLLAGFTVQTLTSPLVQRPTKFQVEQAPAIEHVFDLTAVKVDFARLGRVLPAVPVGIDGAHIILEPQGKTAISRYGECRQLIGPWDACAMLVQSRPAVLKLPSGIRTADYMRFSLELAGIPAQTAEAILSVPGASQLLFLPPEVAKAEIRYARVRGADAILQVYPRSDSGETAYMLDWHEGEFDFRLFGREPETAIALAESLR